MAAAVESGPPPRRAEESKEEEEETEGRDGSTERRWSSSPGAARAAASESVGECCASGDTVEASTQMRMYRPPVDVDEVEGIFFLMICFFFKVFCFFVNRPLFLLLSLREFPYQRASRALSTRARFLAEDVVSYFSFASVFF